jgi:hypothetical protein
MASFYYMCPDNIFNIFVLAVTVTREARKEKREERREKKDREREVRKTREKRGERREKREERSARPVQRKEPRRELFSNFQGRFLCANRRYRYSSYTPIVNLPFLSALLDLLYGG